MTNSLTSAKPASLVIGSDLRAAGANAEWRRLDLPGGLSQTRERIDKLFPESEVGACVLDVLASGMSSENVLIRVDGNRFLCASFYPYPTAVKPRNVVMQATEMSAQLVVDGGTGEVLSANEVADATFGQTPRFAEPLRSAEARATALADLSRTGSHYLGRFKHRRPDGSEVELESILLLEQN